MELRLNNYLSMPTVVSTSIVSTSTMIPTMPIIVMVPVPISTVAVAVIAGTEAEINRRRFDDYSRRGIIGRARGITDRRSRRIIRRWPANNDTWEGWQRQRKPQSDIKAHSGLRSRNGSEENCR